MVQHSVSKQMIQLFNSTIKFKAHCEYIFGEPSKFLTNPNVFYAPNAFTDESDIYPEI